MMILNTASVISAACLTLFLVCTPAVAKTEQQSNERSQENSKPPLKAEPSSPIANAPSPIVRIEPKYPMRAARDGIEGEVVVEVVIDEIGGADQVNVVTAKPTGIFDKAAIKAVKRWKWRPTIGTNGPEKVTATYKLRFQLAP
ncbi:TonB family protein [Corallincola luteus]|uniref:TonB family protein n=2 Tax=Corallincola luteus TaxID=1775177 RepID=A0ABY2ANS5_9GAMM|nr:TonB family protein [Corallincola luteus]